MKTGKICAGTSLGDGCAVLQLEEAGHAISRKAPILAEIVAASSNMDHSQLSTNETSSAPRARCIQETLRKSNLQPEQIEAIFSDGVSIPECDEPIVLALKKVFGPCLPGIPLLLSRKLSGNLLAASGALDVLLATMTIDQGLIPAPNISSESRPVDWVLITSSGWDGQNACLILKRFSA